MTARGPSTSTLARRELVLVAVLLVAFARLVERADAFLVAGLLPVVVLLAGSAVLARRRAPPARPFEALLIPAVAHRRHGRGDPPRARPGCCSCPALRVVRVGPGPGARDRAPAARPADRDQRGRPRRVLAAAVITAFVAFTGIAVLVPGGLPEPGATAADAGLTEGWLLVLAFDDALVALLLGYRVAAARYGSARDAARSAVTYAIVIAVAAGALRAMDVPRLVGPAAADARVLPLGRAPRDRAGAPPRAALPVGDAPARRRSAVVVVAWNLRLPRPEPSRAALERRRV